MSVDKQPQRIQTLFGEIAPRYDFLNHLLSAGVDRYWRWKTVRRSTVPTSGDSMPETRTRAILDVCTGTADLALAYARHLKKIARRSGEDANRYRVVGTDFCEPMLEIGRRKVAAAGCAGHLVGLRVADTLHLPFKAEQFDLVSVAFGLRNVADTDAGIAEMARVCRIGGRVAILEFTMPRGRLIGSLYRFYFRSILPKIGQWFARNRQEAYGYLPASVGEFPQYEALLARMEGAGFSQLRFYPMTFGIATLYLGTKTSRPPNATR